LRRLQCNRDCEATPPPRAPFTLVLQFLKAGYAADNLPRHIIPSIVGRPVLRAEEEALGE